MTVTLHEDKDLFRITETHSWLEAEGPFSPHISGALTVITKPIPVKVVLPSQDRTLSFEAVKVVHTLSGDECTTTWSGPKEQS